MLKDSLFPTSFAQRRLWFIQKMLPASTAYNIVFSVELPFAPDAAAFQHALNELAARHEGLRTSFIFKGEEPIQVIAARGELPLRVHDLRHAAPEAEQEFARLVSASVSEPFDLSASPLARAHLGLLDGARARLALVVHHIIADGQSVRILAAELEEMYRARVSGRLAPLPELPVQYADYSVWQRRMLSGRRLERLTEYWRRRLDGLPELELHHDGARPRGGSVRGAVHRFTIPAEVVRRLRAVANNSGATLFATLLAAFSATLGRFTGQSELAVGTPVSGRPKPELERVVGLFVNSVVLRADLSGRPTFQELVKRTGAALAEDLTHQDFPFELLVDALNAKRRADRNPLFQVMFQLQVREPSQAREQRRGHAHTETPAGGGGRPSPDAVTSQLDLSFIQYEKEGGQVEGGAVYAAELFEPETIEQLTEAYVRALTDAAEHPSRCIDQLRLLSEQGQREVLALGEGERRAWPRGVLLHEWFARQAEASKESTALVDGEAELSFGELQARSDAFAAALRRKGVRPGCVVAICLPRSTESVAAVLGVLKAAGAYVCLDADAPRPRLEFIVSDCDAAVVVAPRERGELGFGRQLLAPCDVPARADDEEGGTVERASEDDPAYVIYTSGSTGQPKGVAISHRAIVNHMRWMLERFPLGAEDRVLQRTPLTFDASVWELYAPLLSGTTLVLAPEGRLFDPARLSELIARRRVTTLQVVPSLLRALLAAGDIESCTTLKRVFCGGEALTPDIRDAFFLKSNAELCNLYGPTETTVDATFHVCRRDDRRAFVPIGRPIANVNVRVLDEHQVPVPLGVAGELYLGGAAVGVGYVNRPEMTAERFVPDPYAAGARLFRTRDRVRMLAGGELQYLGRLDGQVKLRGFRVELGEIESVLSLHPLVRDAAAVVQEHGAGDQRLVAFVVPAGGEASSLKRELRAWLRERLPEYLIPSAIETLGSLPKTAHGKVDRASLSQAQAARGSDDEQRVAPRDAFERDVCRCFGELLGVGDVGIDDNFFHLGGHSLLVIPLRDKLSGAVGREVDVVDVFEYPTPRQLAKALKARATARDVVGAFK